MHVDLKDDTRQAVVVAKNEIKKFMRGKKILIFTALFVLILGMMAAIPYILGDGYDSAGVLSLTFVSFITLLLVLASVLFTSTSIVSEFEERTALILFTKPIRKGAIFVGKLLASIVVLLVYFAIFYVFIAVYSLATQGEVAGDLVLSFGMCICAIFGFCGVSMLFSSLAKKASTASILTLVMLLVIFSIFASLIDMYDFDTSWIITEACNSVSSAIGRLDFDGIKPVLVDTSVDLVHDAAVMIGWGIACNVVAYFIFKKRDF